MATLMDGYLDSVPRFKHLRTAICHKRARKCYLSIYDTITNLGRAVQLGQHRRLIDGLNRTLSADTLEAIAVASFKYRELCCALSVYLTTLEQVYAWPRRDVVLTPQALHNHKLVIQVLYHENLTEMMSLRINSTAGPRLAAVPVSEVALATANELLRNAKEAKRNNTALPQVTQDQVNLLFRNCSQDWYMQGDYQNIDCHTQFGRLHEMVRTTGTQRSVQKLFQDNAGVGHLQRVHNLLHDIPNTMCAVVRVLQDIQTSVTLAREELFSMAIDEIIWGQTFAKVSKPVSYSTIGAGGADCPMFRMLDALCGRHDPTTADALLEELTMRSRNFPPNIRSLIHDIASAPSLRALATSDGSSLALQHSFSVFQQLMYGLYEMHQKKALRIMLALRAGQLYTSSGTQNAASPEHHLARILQSAIDVRFGTDALDRTIPAYGNIVSSTLDTAGNAESAKIRFRFTTPLVIGAGDAIRVTVAINDRSTKTRTYSVTNINLFADEQSYGNTSFSPATSVEICCRKSGTVSSFLCSQRGEFKVRLALQPNSHFRLVGNRTNNENTIFIAQNGAVGVFCAWLSRQPTLVGRYKLLVGTRQLKTFPYASEVRDCAQKHGNQLQVILCFSQPSQEDMWQPKCGKVRSFAGRVTEFLANNPLSHARATYVCGSAAFSIAVTKKMNEKKITKKSMLGPRFSPIVNSRMPKLRLHVASPLRTQLEKQTSLRPVSRWELALHNVPDDMWISLNRVVYDISMVSSFHPGGEKVLIYRAGLEADDMFNSVHAENFEVKSILSTLEVGYLQDQVPEDNTIRQCLDAIVQMQNDLTNSTRFEERPTGSINQLPRVPPAELIRGSWTQFLASWIALLCSLPLCEQLIQTVRNAMDNWLASIAEKQRELYESSFNDMRCCAEGLKELFEAHERVAATTHTILDGLKLQFGQLEFHNELPNTITMATRNIIQGLKRD